MSNITNLPVPRAVRPAPRPFGLYFRPGWNEHRDLLTALEAGKTSFFGAIFDPTRMARQKELRERVFSMKLDAVLDPRTQISATVGGYNDDLGALPWGLGRRHSLSDFQDQILQRKMIGALADFTAANGFTALIAPTHIIHSANDPWLSIDAASVRALRNFLDRKNSPKVPIFYSLALTSAAFRDQEQRQAIIHSISKLPIDALWIKVDGFGSRASPTAARIHIDGLAEFHELSIPIIADQVGGLVGLSLIAFGSVGGIAHGITSGEQYSAGALIKPKSGNPFSPSRRIYVPAIDLLLKVPQAKMLLENSPRGRVAFGCTNSACCPRGIVDMLQNPGRHFICQRIEEVTGLARIPADLRTQRFLDQHVRAATDKAVLAANAKYVDEKLSKKTQEQRKRLDNLRIALGTQATDRPPQTFSAIPDTRIVREG